jgi:glutathione S-transferase
MLKVLGRRSSGNVMKVLWALEELGLEYRQIDVGGKFGGNAETDYLASKFGAGSLCPTNLQSRATAETWMDWQLTALAPMIRPVFHGLVRNKPEDRDFDSINAGIEQGNRLLAMLDTHLEGRSFIAGNEFTMGDIPIGPIAHRFVSLVKDRPKTNNFDVWYERLTERPAFQKICMIPLE